MSQNQLVQDEEPVPDSQSLLVNHDSSDSEHHETPSSI